VIKDQEANWKDAVLQNGFSTNHDLSFTKSTENSRISLVRLTDGIVKILV
jgi:iron complex outermembrane receptor protein